MKLVRLVFLAARDAIYGEPAHAGCRAALFQRLRALPNELADSLDLTTAFPNF